MIVALGFAAGGIWTNAVMAWLKPMMTKGDDAGILTIGAIVVAVVVVVVIITLTRLFKIEKK